MTEQEIIGQAIVEVKRINSCTVTEAADRVFMVLRESGMEGIASLVSGPLSGLLRSGDSQAAPTNGRP